MVKLETLALTSTLLAAVLAPSHAFVFAPAGSTAGAGRIGAQHRNSVSAASGRWGSAIGAAAVPAPAPAAGGSGRRGTAVGASVRQVTAEELEKEMTDWDLPLILDVFAIWCGPCVMLKPEIEKVAQALDGKCRVLKMDSDDEEEMASTLNVYGLPTILYMKDGVMTHRTEGSMPAEEILQLADIHLFGAAPPGDLADELFIDMDACKPVDPPAAAAAATAADAACMPAADACKPVADACKPVVDACKPTDDASSSSSSSPSACPRS